MTLFRLLMAALLAVSIAAPAFAADETPKKKKPKKEYDYENSRYKSYKTLTEDQERTYRFNEKGEPIKPPVKKAKKKPAKKTSEPEPSEGDSANCEADQSCRYQEGSN